MPLKSALLSNGDRERQERRRSRAEKRVAKKTASDLTPASGAFLGMKGDMRSRDRKLRIEHKWTSLKSYRIVLETLAKLVDDSRLYDETPILVISFENTTKGVPSDWAVLPLHELEKLRGREK